MGSMKDIMNFNLDKRDTSKALYFTLLVPPAVSNCISLPQPSSISLLPETFRQEQIYSYSSFTRKNPSEIAEI